MRSFGFLGTLCAYGSCILRFGIFWLFRSFWWFSIFWLFCIFRVLGNLRFFWVLTCFFGISQFSNNRLFHLEINGEVKLSLELRIEEVSDIDRVRSEAFNIIVENNIFVLEFDEMFVVYIPDDVFLRDLLLKECRIGEGRCLDEFESNIVQFGLKTSQISIESHLLVDVWLSDVRKESLPCPRKVVHS